VVDRPILQHVVDERGKRGLSIHLRDRTEQGVIEDHFDSSYELEDTLNAREGARIWALMADLPRRATGFTRQQAPLGLGMPSGAPEIVGTSHSRCCWPDMVTKADRAEPEPRPCVSLRSAWREYHRSRDLGRRHASIRNRRRRPG